MSSIRIEVTYPHPRDRVWTALTDSQAMAEWLMPNDFEPHVGHRFTMRTDPAPGFDGIVHCRVLEIEAPRRLSYTWRGGPIDTVLTFELEETAGGTLLRVRQEGFKGLKANLVRLILKSGSRAIYYKKLPEVLGRLAGEGDDGEPPIQTVGCDNRGAWRVLAFVFGPILRRGGKR